MSTTDYENPQMEIVPFEFLVSPEEVAWAAGFLEGEGWFAYRGNQQMRIGVTQVNREPLDRLKELFGGHIHFHPQDPNVRQSFWTWELSQLTRCHELTRLVVPWLTESKREKIPWLA